MQVNLPQRGLVGGFAGNLQGRSVVLFLSGCSMTNAAMTAQLALDRFNITDIIVGGIAGSVNPSLPIGDVIVVRHPAANSLPKEFLHLATSHRAFF